LLFFKNLFVCFAKFLKNHLKIKPLKPQKLQKPKLQKNFMIYILNANEWAKCQRQDKNTTLKK
jgi:hypothetical protein